MDELGKEGVGVYVADTRKGIAAAVRSCGMGKETRGLGNALGTFKGRKSSRSRDCALVTREAIMVRARPCSGVRDSGERAAKNSSSEAIRSRRIPNTQSKPGVVRWKISGTRWASGRRRHPYSPRGNARAPPLEGTLARTLRQGADIGAWAPALRLLGNKERSRPHIASGGA